MMKSMMPMVANRARANRLMRDVISDLNLDLRGITVLTEAASGAFAATSLIAALAGAERVIAVTRDSSYGSAAEVSSYLMEWAGELGVHKQIEVTTDIHAADLSDCSLVTNLGFVRPINASLVERLADDAVVALMWEPWEFRSEDIDLAYCLERGVPVIGTNEEHPRLMIFAYLGLLAQKLLFEADVEVFKARLLLVASDPFGKFIEASLVSAGAHVHRVAVEEIAQVSHELIANLDAVVLSEHRDRRLLIGEGAIPAALLADARVPLIHLCGEVDHAAVTRTGVQKVPEKIPSPGFMTVTTDYLGPRPVIDLHAAGLKVGEAAVRTLRATGDSMQAEAAAMDTGLAAVINRD